MNLTGIVESPVRGVDLTTVLTVSTRHMPEHDEDLSECSWGACSSLGTEFFYAYEDPFDGLPDWLFKICTVARDKYNANWVLLDPDGDVFEDDFPIYDTPD
jgi:hypothetical protein